MDWEMVVYGWFVIIVWEFGKFFLRHVWVSDAD
jgi:hypothetical protein